MDDSQLLTGDQGHLVSQILETQKELDTSVASESLQKVDIVSKELLRHLITFLKGRHCMVSFSVPPFLILTKK